MNSGPLIAIVGRPNVGKSTLFNRLADDSHALVANIPGITRDCLQGNGHFEQYAYRLLDTSGLPGIAAAQPGSGTATVEALAMQRTLEQIRNADCLLWLVDFQAGPLPADACLAEQLRKQKAPCLLVVNKAESVEPEIAATEFHALGIGQPYPISATHGTGVDTLMQTLLGQLAPHPHHDTTTTAPDILTIGRPNVGKSTLVNSLLRSARMITSEVPGTTHDNVVNEMRYADQIFQLVDTPGIRRRARVQADMDRYITGIALAALNDASLVMLVVDAQEGVTEQDARLAGQTLQRGGRLVIVVNKWDLIPPGERRDKRAYISHQLRFASGARIHCVSALKGQGIKPLRAELERRSATPTPTTATLNRILREATAHRPPPVVNGRRVRLLYAHAGGRRPLQIIIHGRGGNLPTSYRKYLSNRIREALQLPGHPIRIEFTRPK